MRSSLKCPACVTQKQMSTVTILGTSGTLMNTREWYDTDGEYHYEDPNTYTTQYRCSQGHGFEGSERGDVRNLRVTYDPEVIDQGVNPDGWSFTKTRNRIDGRVTEQQHRGHGSWGEMRTLISPDPERYAVDWGYNHTQQPPIRIGPPIVSKDL